MKSKTSFFNKTIFLKNVTLYWPLWGLYTLILVIMQPIVLFLNNYYDGLPDAVTAERRFCNLIDQLYMGSYIWILVIAATIFAMALFSYLYNSKSANMIHSLPVDRNQLFGTNVLSGLAFLILPQIFTAGWSLLVCAVFEIEKAWYIGIWLLMVMGMSVIFFAVATICAMFTGLLLALPFYIVIANALSYWVYGLLYYVVAVFGYGVELYTSGAIASLGTMVGFLSPFAAMLNCVSIDRWYRYNDYGEELYVEVTGLGVIGIYVVVGLVLFYLAYRFYQKRHIEQAGDLLTVSWLKPFFRWGVGTSGGIFGALLLKEILGNMRIGCPLPVFLILMVLLGGLCYFFADMFVKKNFRVFYKKNWIGCAKFTVLLFVTFFTLFGITKYQEHYVPSEEHIEWAEIHMNYGMEFTGEEIQKVTELHEQLLACIPLCRSYENRWNTDYASIRINYALTDGRYISRRYRVPMEEEAVQKILNQVMEMETDVDIFIDYFLSTGDLKEPEFVSAQASFIVNSEEEQYEWKSFEFKMEEAEQLYEAALKDAENLVKYNIYGKYDYYGSSYNREPVPDISYTETGSLYIHILGKYDNVEGMAYRDIHLNFGPDCEHLIQTLIALGCIESADDIYWK